MRTPLSIFLLLVATQAFAADPVSYCKLGQCEPRPAGGAIKTAQALNASQANRTTTAVNVEGYSVLRLTINYTRVAGTDFRIDCETSDDNSTNWRHLDPPNSAGQIVAGDPIYSYATLTSSRVMDFPIGVGGLVWVRCYPTVTSAGASDLYTATYALFL